MLKNVKRFIHYISEIWKRFLPVSAFSVLRQKTFKSVAHLNFEFMHEKPSIVLGSRKRCGLKVMGAWQPRSILWDRYGRSLRHQNWRVVFIPSSNARNSPTSGPPGFVSLLLNKSGSALAQIDCKKFSMSENTIGSTQAPLYYWLMLASFLLEKRTQLQTPATWKL